ncbi:protein BIG GRAIN 1-like A isoform X2 [Rhodamnia argentea]|uniref:Protein BIG GRAIN 1-like A isoform X2 n=1 Tax=Rhodamnia argentea TaxID=178133 RepID=A0A8B8NVC8_9MYRT|nr:protein BIG GRAIN 1-like A isoform X2 [Rhodamnia argentea]
MDPCDGSHRTRHHERRDNPSFSSTLLDAIYRSIDGESPPEHPMVFYADDATRIKQDAAGVRRDYLIEKWMAVEEEEEEKKKKKKEASDEREAVRRSSWSRSMPLTNSSSSSSDSSSRSGGGFSSSESESRSRSSASCYSVRRPKPKPKPAPIRTSASDRTATAFDRGQLDPRKSQHAQSQRPSNNTHEGLGFVKTKSKALKIYADLNSIFTVGSPKKPKIVTSSVDGDQSACSSASSFSRSCLSNTPSSRSKPSVVGGGPKQRSVRFYPEISVIVDDPARQNKDPKMAAKISPAKVEFDKPIFGDESRRIAEAAREMLRSYQKKKGSYDNEEGDEDEDEDDAASCASSDLFELDNLSSIGCDQMRYREELPVYETTNLDTNRAIASGLVL